MLALAARPGSGRPWSLLAGCGTIDQRARGGPGQRLDPGEKWNRKVFNFNDDVDRTVLKPVATAYTDVVPQPLRRGVNNFFNNFADAWSVDQQHPAGQDPTRSSRMRRGSVPTPCSGWAGFLDVASEMGLDRHYEDFGQTLGRYGVGAGAYVVLPVLGPSTVRDTRALPVDRLASPPGVLRRNEDADRPDALQIVNTRAGLLGATRVIDDIALDKYTFVRDAYLQRRRSLVFDGDVPEARRRRRDRFGGFEPLQEPPIWPRRLPRPLLRRPGGSGRRPAR